MSIPENALAGKRIALIGGAGFIGHNFALQLARLGAEPHVIDGLQVNNMGAFTNGIGHNPNRDLYIALITERLDLLRKHRIPLHVLDARDYPLLSRCIDDIKPHVVVQLAAIAHANRANKDPYSTFDHSMRTLENALDCSRVMGVEQFIFFSSSMVYGNFEGDAVCEDRVCNPIGIYGALKFGGEKLVIAYNQVFGLPYTIIRPSALYGERCVSRRVGQAFIENALRGLDLTINGDGTDGLDFTYVQDLIQGLVLAILKPQARNQVFNLTYGGARTIEQMAELVKQHFPGVSVIHNPRDSLMPERGTLCIDKARDLLGYEPEWPLEKGFLRYIEWYKALAAEQSELFK